MTAESLEWWKSAFEIGGVALLLFTFIAGAGVVWFSRKLNSIQAQQLQQFDKDLTDAKTELGKQEERAAVAERELKGVDTKTEGFRLAIAEANERAAKAQESLALAEQHSAEANAKAEGFKLDIAQANKSAAEANRIAEQERLARLQLEARLADRIILPAQEQSLRTAFARLKGQTVDVVVLGDTVEISQFSGKIIASMKAAEVLINLSRPFGGGSARGVLVGVKADAPSEVKQTAQEFTAILQQTIGGGIGPWDFEALKFSGAAMVTKDKGAAPVGTSPFRIFIGSK